MAPKNSKLSSKDTLPIHNANKFRRQAWHVKQKQTRDSAKRDVGFRRKREEDKDPQLREERLRRNVPMTLERKRVWDEVDREEDAVAGVSVDVEHLKRQRVEAPAPPEDGQHDARNAVAVHDDGRDETDSMLDSSSDHELDVDNDRNAFHPQPDQGYPEAQRASSPSASIISTKLDMNPEALAAKFPSLFNPQAAVTPKILVTTSINSTLHYEARLLTTLFPHSVYIRRSAHRYGHKFSVREIASFASNRSYTALLILKEDQKKPTGLSIVHLPDGPTFHFSISNWVEGKKLPGHGNPTNHFPELILNNFRTPLGLLTAHLFRSLFPPQPELHGRQVVTLHNQRDYIFVRRHRYVFRDKRPTERSVVGSDGKEVKGVEDIRTGLQELGPRFTLKLRRIDKSIGRAGSGGETEWEWKGRLEKERTKFQL
ncbi:MAG: hypothetical protein M1833_000117 [Piccolia ochrophora]|nr:MAG: hypothetical protein M1833_000117 [Piccolia ochrophora]